MKQLFQEFKGNIRRLAQSNVNWQLHLCILRMGLGERNFLQSKTEHCCNSQGSFPLVARVNPRADESDFIRSQCSHVYLNEVQALAVCWQVGFAITGKETLHCSPNSFVYVFAFDYHQTIVLIKWRTISQFVFVFLGETLPSSGKEAAELRELRSTLLTFLRDSRWYQPRNLLSHFPDSK